MANIELQTSRAIRAYRVLVKRAKDKKFITYGELAETISTRNDMVHHRGCRYFLELIGRYCDRNNLPLQILVISKKERIPGKGFWGYRRTTPALKKNARKVSEHHWGKIPNFRKYFDLCS